MKKAFTMVELIFVLVVAGILAAVIMPRMERDPLREAGIQLLSHIRYTQHLAMVDDKYNVADTNWYRNRWQIMFEKGIHTGGTESYTIFADTAGGSTGNADVNEIAYNPTNKAKRLTGGTDGIPYGDDRTTLSMNLGKKYGIKDLEVTGGTSSTAQRILFDNLGRPYNIGATSISPQDGVATNAVFVKMCLETCSGANDKATNDKELVIRIEYETGYPCILEVNSNNTCIE